jgi:glutamate N-acetyltransferase/amino-acid N-acetyltransferase
MTIQTKSFAFMKEGGVTTPQGWRAASVACGMRYKGRDDLALLVSDVPSAAAAMFTTNAVKSAHVLYDRELMARNPAGIQAVMINSGSANACTGDVGLAAAATTAHALERALELPPDSVFVMSTGVIAMQLPVDKMLQGIAQAVPKLDAAHGYGAARAIMTTDIHPKQCAVRVELPGGAVCHIGGMAKGSGMIHPNMATMLAVITTDATLTPESLDTALRYAVNRSFHCISVDGDTSTNDTALLLANGQADLPPIHIDAIDDNLAPEGQAFVAALTAVCQYLAQEVARDGEGATRFVTINVRGAASDSEAHTAAMAVARSPLVKTALFGADPNWGRVICALGYSGATVDPNRMVLYLGTQKVFAHGLPLDFDEALAHEQLDAPEALIEADLGLGSGSATAWTCDFSYDYVKINAEYRS